MAKPVIERAGGLRLSKFSGGEGGGDAGGEEGPWIDDTISRPPRAAVGAWKFRPLSEIDALAPPAWLLQRYVPEDALMMIYGAPNSFKSCIAKKC